MKDENLIYGTRAIIEAVNANTTIDKVFVQKDGQSDLHRELLKTLKKANINFQYVPVEKLNRLTHQNHQGVVATISPIGFIGIEELIESTMAKKENPLFLILDEISDARNFGAIIRTAECSGVDGIIIPMHGAAPVNGDTIKTSAGAVFNIPICKINHIKDAIFHLQSAEIQIIAATEKTEDLIYNLDLKKPTALIMGSEDKGINPSVLKIVDQKVKLPMYGNIGSLNVSVACGAFLYEIVRQRI